jgi:hypothetical protein
MSFTNNVDDLPTRMLIPGHTPHRHSMRPHQAHIMDHHSLGRRTLGEPAGADNTLIQVNLGEFPSLIPGAEKN